MDENFRSSILLLPELDHLLQHAIIVYFLVSHFINDFVGLIGFMVSLPR